MALIRESERGNCAPKARDRKKRRGTEEGSQGYEDHALKRPREGRMQQTGGGRWSPMFRHLLVEKSRGTERLSLKN